MRALEPRGATEDRYLRHMSEGKSDLMIKNCHESGIPYLRYVKERHGFVRVWPLIHVMDDDTMLSEGRY